MTLNQKKIIKYFYFIFIGVQNYELSKIKKSKLHASGRIKWINILPHRKNSSDSCWKNMLTSLVRFHDHFPTTFCYAYLLVLVPLGILCLLITFVDE